MTVVSSTPSTTGQDDLFRLVRGYFTTRTLLALWRLGVLEQATAGQDVALSAVAGQLGTRPERLRPTFDYLVVRGFLEPVSPGVYRASDRAKAASPYFGYLSTMVGGYEPVLGQLEKVMTGALVYGQSVSRDAEEMVRGLTALEDRLMGTVIDVVHSTGARKVLDLGCGSAAMLAHICAANPDVQAVGVDLDPDSCAVARETVQRHGLADRVTIVQGDAADLGALPRSVLDGVDMVTAMFLLHQILGVQGRPGTVRLLDQISELLRGNGGHLTLVEVAGTSEYVYREDQLFVPEYELLHDYTDQQLAPRPEWEAMCAEAGMKVVDALPVNMCKAFCLLATPIEGAAR